MPSKDTFHEKKPELNESIVPAKPPGIGLPERGPRASKTAQREMSAQLQRLAARLGVSADKLAKKYPEDTIRRTKYGVLEQVNEDGTRTFKHDPGIAEGARGTLNP